ncbi:tyrosine-type recombinase/integrase [Mycobacteroides abscessus]|uniref:Transposase n=1 Tax=Mycobacteroides abscessus TaxID=36809 RepID=A0ABD7HGB9_9MYCO|nr:tyrosine-type recombinase/integrase [Mycobacteroides abscessus]PVB10799.1 transposase [Mycobacteroides abscessus]RIR38802.1 transposase [Mycobacteroides abscessus]RIR67522.1 transposase [Mycobacteroides abscessus]RIS54945.1 transposase [Mycobacteroides abscessus]RIT28611.1 transposase [Mycobacteroides abscessus]
MTPTNPPTEHPRAESTESSPWEQQWAKVPAAWRKPVYRIDTAPFSEVFVQNRYYTKAASACDGYDFSPSGPPRFSDELAWWVYTCWREGLRRIDPAKIAWFTQALPDATAEYRNRHGRAPTTLLDISVPDIIRHATRQFEQRRRRLPTPSYRRNLQWTAEHLHTLLAARCTPAPWWSHDVWDLRIDPQIPQREHEPHHERVLKLADIQPLWLREGLRFWMRTAITHQLFTWTTAVARCQTLGRHLGRFCHTNNYVNDPLITTDPDELRSVFLDFLAYLRSPDATTKPGTLSAYLVAEIQYQVQAFYTFMHDHDAEAAAATGDKRWKDIGIGHTRLWAPAYLPRKTRRSRELTWYSTADLQRMLSYLDVLAADTEERVVLTHPDGAISVMTGLGDPQAARAWLLQAMTGRRASEILMLDHDPLEAIPGVTPAAGADSGIFVARLRYQQTKVAGVDPTILIEQQIVDVIREQQRWLSRRHPGIKSKYLFVGMVHQHQGQRARPYTSYLNSLKKLDTIHRLTDAQGNPLRFSQTHRLRHTRATELLNDGVPFHVVQRYLGHRSPEMTARYAATLAATSEAEFLKHKKIGAHGADIAISPSDIYEITQLSKRTDRVLPNGVCLLPPLKSCDKGNACLSCGHFATDRTHLDDLRNQLTSTEELLAQRRRQFAERTGRELTDDNIWVSERLREISSIQAIIARLNNQVDALADNQSGGIAVAGAATAGRRPQLPILTRGAHETTISHANTRRHSDD